MTGERPFSPASSLPEHLRDDGRTLSDFMPGDDAGPEGIAHLTAAPGNADAGTLTEDSVVDALKTVHDPEIPINLYDLGLIYGIALAEDGGVSIDMTLTAPGCPVAGQMPYMVARAVIPVPGVKDCRVQLVWEPGWTKDRMSEDAKLALDMF